MGNGLMQRAKKYLVDLFNSKKKISTEDYIKTKRNFDKATSDLTSIANDNKAQKADIEHKLSNCVRTENNVGFDKYSKVHKIYESRETNLENALIAVDIVSIGFREKYEGQRLKQTIENIKSLTNGVLGASDVYESLDEMQALILESVNGDVYQTDQNVQLQPWQKELKAKIEAQIEADAEAAQGIEEKVKKKAEVETGA